MVSNANSFAVKAFSAAPPRGCKEDVCLPLEFPPCATLVFPDGHEEALDPKCSLESLSKRIKSCASPFSVKFPNGYVLKSGTKDFKAPATCPVRVTDGTSCLDEDRIAMNADEKFASFFSNLYAARDAQDSLDKKKVRINSSKDAVKFANGLQISFNRTLRVPDDGRTYPLPAGLGRLPIENVSVHKDRLPAPWSRRGGVFFPLYQREAFWISFLSPEPCAVRIGVGNVNALTGEPWGERSTKQDYVVVPVQPWIDGICSGEGVVRQFVAMPLGMGYTVEEQLTKKDWVGGLRFEVIYSLPNDFAVAAVPPVGVMAVAKNSLTTRTPRELGYEPGRTVYVTSWQLGSRDVTVGELGVDEQTRLVVESDVGLSCVFVKTPTGKIVTVMLDDDVATIYDLKQKLQNLEGLPPGQHRLVFSNKQLEDDKTLDFYNIQEKSTLYLILRLRGGGGPEPMGVAAGGNIEQRIYKDPLPERWDWPHATQLFVHVLNSTSFAEVTGNPAPPCPISAKTYKESKIPWYSLYDEKFPALPGSNALCSVQPITALDAVSKLREADCCPVCFTAMADTQLLPCRHVLCLECIQKLPLRMEGSSSPIGQNRTSSDVTGGQGMGDRPGKVNGTVKSEDKAGSGTTSQSRSCPMCRGNVVATRMVVAPTLMEEEACRLDPSLVICYDWGQSMTLR